tara:strand:- start:354 stop:773 length:420 start_codon:yes stop_codon:yes gene_type:complete
MSELLSSCWTLIAGLFGSAWDILTLVAVWGWEILYHLHVSAPRLEGLLIGVTLAWLLLRREKHPLLRVLSAPLKLVLDILDLAWDQVAEVAGDLWGTASGWVGGILGWCKSKVKWAYDKVMGALRGVKDKLLNLKKKEE